MSDEALQTAWRAARGTPDDPALRRAYAAQLERAGHRAAAFVERSMASMLDGGEAPEPPLLEAGEAGQERRLVAPLPWPRLDVVGPDRDDARLPGAGVIGARAASLRLASTPVALVPWPTCRAGCARGRVECDACGGRGSTLEFTGRADERIPCEPCGGLGQRRCEACDGWDLDPDAREGCAHDAGWPLELELAPGSPGLDELALAQLMAGNLEPGEGPRELEAPPTQTRWTLRRCPTCGLASLRRHTPGDDEGDDHPACPECGHFRCMCGLDQF